MKHRVRDKQSIHSKRPLSSKSKRLLAIMLSAVLVLGISFTTYAWLVQKEHSIQNKAVITDFNIGCDVYFLDGTQPDNTVTLPDLENKATYQKPDGNSMIRVSFDKTAPNYIGNLRLVVRFNGGSPAYIRVKILEQWTVDDTFIASTLTPYTVPDKWENIFGVAKENWISRLFPSWGQKNSLNADTSATWFDNRKNDYCFYYNTPLYPLDTGKEIKLLLLNGISDANFDSMTSTNSKTELNLIFEAEAVQPNRYREFWGKAELPWEENNTPSV